MSDTTAATTATNPINTFFAHLAADWQLVEEDVITAVQASVNSLTAAGVPIPISLVNGLNSMNQAVAGVNQALNNQAVSSDASKALKEGYFATKALQIAAAQAAAMAGAVQAATAPATPPAPASS